MIFLSAQQDNLYCLWQLYVQMANFRRHGIEKDAVVLIATVGSRPSREALEFARQTKANVFFFEDKRRNQTYVASVYFYLVKQFLTQQPVYENIFFHDGDIIFRELPRFSTLLDDENWYWSDTANYLSPKLYDKDPFVEMIQIVDVAPSVVLPQQHVGGAQNIFKIHNASFWDKVEERSVNLHSYMLSAYFQRHHITKKRIDPWLAGMWALLWSAYEEGYPVATHKELDFTWPVYRANTWWDTKILHNAGVGPSQRQMFYKGGFTHQSPFKQKHSYVSADFASYFYAREVEYAAKTFDVTF